MNIFNKRLPCTTESLYSSTLSPFNLKSMPKDCVRRNLIGYNQCDNQLEASYYNSFEKYTDLHNSIQYVCAHRCNVNSQTG